MTLPAHATTAPDDDHAPEPWRWSATTLRERLARRECSVEDVARATLARIDAVNPAINAIVECRPEAVLAQARVLDRRFAARADGEPLPPLAGVPVAIKVNVDQAGFATTNGVRSQAGLVAEHDSPVVSNLLAAGALPIGRSNTPAFSYRWFTSNRLHGRTLNPHDARLTPGGSSGGSAAAVAAGLATIGHGTDIAGSIRYPAYACGLHGLRPSFGRVAAYNASAGRDRTIGGQLMAVSGPIARRIADLRLALEALAAPDARDPWWVPAPLAGAPVPRRARLCRRPDGLVIDEAVEQALLAAADALRDAGWQVDETDTLPPLAAAVDLQLRLWMGDGYDAQVAAAAQEGDPGAIAALAGQRERVGTMTAAALSDALVRRATFARDWALFLEHTPLVLLPTSGELPFEQDLDLQGPAAYARVWAVQLTQVALPFVGLPALQVCTGLTPRGPVGVQLVAARFREDVVLDAGEAIEARLHRPRVVTPGRG